MHLRAWLWVQVAQRITGAVASRFYGYESVLSPLIADACIAVCPKNPTSFNVDNVRVAKIPGGGVQDSQLIQGMLIKRDAEGTLRQTTDAKVAVFAQGIDTSGTETKVSVSFLLVHNFPGAQLAVMPGLEPSMHCWMQTCHDLCEQIYLCTRCYHASGCGSKVKIFHTFHKISTTCTDVHDVQSQHSMGRPICQPQSSPVPGGLPVPTWQQPTVAAFEAAHNLWLSMDGA